MKYIAIIDEDMLNGFELIHDGKTLVLEDKNGTTRPVKIKPNKRNGSMQRRKERISYARSH